MAKDNALVLLPSSLGLTEVEASALQEKLQNSLPPRLNSLVIIIIIVPDEMPEA